MKRLALVALALAALTSAVLPALASGAGSQTAWQRTGNAACRDFYDQATRLQLAQVAAITTSPTTEAYYGAVADLMVEVARLSLRTDDRLASLRVPRRHARTLARMVRIDRHANGKILLKMAALTRTHLDSDEATYEALERRQQRESVVFNRLAKQLGLTACAG